MNKLFIYILSKYKIPKYIQLLFLLYLINFVKSIRVTVIDTVVNFSKKPRNVRSWKIAAFWVIHYDFTIILVKNREPFFIAYKYPFLFEIRDSKGDSKISPFRPKSNSPVTTEIRAFPRDNNVAAFLSEGPVPWQESRSSPPRRIERRYRFPVRYFQLYRREREAARGLEAYSVPIHTQ